MILQHFVSKATEVKMDDLQLLGFLAMVAISHFEALLMPVALAAAAVFSAAPLKFEPIAV